MYRLLKLHKLYPPKLMSSPLCNQYSVQTCIFCEHNFNPRPKNYALPHFQNLESRRCLSTKTRTILHNNLNAKKKRKIVKKYAELLEVTEGSSSEKKASVSNLKPKHLSLLVDQPNTSLAQLHNLKKSKSQIRQESLKQKESTNELKDPRLCFQISELEELSENCTSELDKSTILDQLGLLDNGPEFHHQLDQHNIETDEIDEGDKSFVEMHDIERKSLKQFYNKSVNTVNKGMTSFKKKAREEMVKVKQDELDRIGREESLARSLYTYLEICVACHLYNRGLSTLIYYRQRAKWSNNKNMPGVSDVALYNMLLHAYAGRGNLTKVKEILHILHSDKISLDAQSYAACFECIGRIHPSPETTTLLHKFHRDMINDDITLNDLMVKCQYTSDQREVVLSVIKRIQPGFEPNIPPPDICYSCNLLQDLNLRDEELRFKSPAEGLMTKEHLRELAKQQIKIEMGDYIKVPSIEKRSEPTETILYYRTKLEETQANWKIAINDAFQRDLEAFRAQHQSFKTFRQLNLYPYLKALEPKHYTNIILREIRKLAEGSETFSPTINQLYRELGNKVRARYLVKFKVNSGIMNKVERLYEDYCDWYLEPGESTSQNTRQQWQRLVYLNQSGPNVNFEERHWPITITTAVGKFLYNIIMHDIKIDINVIHANSKTQHLLPAFYTLFRSSGRLLKEEMKPHPVLSRLFRGAAQEELDFDVTSVPMLSPPLPWSSVTSGGYLVAKTDIIRLPQQAVQQWQRLIETPKPQLYPALDSLNQLGAVPWTVNQSVLDIVIQVFNNGGSLRLDIPEPPSACPSPEVFTPDMNKLERFQAYRNRMSLRRQKAEMYSLWCDALYRLSLANHFRDRVFWLPHNMDFRGRVYPCPPHLNHLGSDMARSILSFAKGEPLGPNGLDWLKIHLVNLTGLKKREPVSERLEYAEELMPDIIESAENPLTGRMWWAESEEPWQTLACCMEIDHALKSPDPTKYTCHFPIHQDGSCNGLQHYAALGRDQVGAESVNLTPAFRPQDVYSRVAALVERERAKDAATGLKVAEVLNGFIRRKVIKQTVMTTVYGVTRFGARLQIARQLKDIDQFPREFVWSGSTYLVMKTFESLREMFTSTKEIQDWFTECARLISQVCGQNVEWITPLGLPVVQPYNRFNKKLDVQTKSLSKLQEHYAMDMFERPNVMKQKNAFPPNFIHSLDSSHMMLTSLYCERKGISFVSVHDCFWTHPSTVDTMNKVCREQFVSLHSQPILEELSKFLAEKYSYDEPELNDDNSLAGRTKHRLNNVLTTLPLTGNFEIDSVLKSVYFFS